MKSKIGESQVIQFFSTAVEIKLQEKFGCQAKYSIGNFSGIQDRKFADFFVGTESACILIEFKEFENEIADEQKKPLRKKLCTELTQETARLSRASHFIAYRKPGSDLEIIVTPYVDTVCPLFSVSIPPLADKINQNHQDFIEDFLSNKAGQDYKQFIRYVGHMNSTAGGTSDGATAPFKSVLYSKNKQGKIIGTIFESIGELSKLLNL